MRALFVGSGLLLSLMAAAPAAGQTTAELEDQVRATERAFAKSMADRDLAAFTAHLSDEAVFMGGTTLRGRQAITDGWAPFFKNAQAPFSWEPETVVVLESGTLALSSDGRELVAANMLNNSISFVNIMFPNAAELIQEVPVGSDPRDVTLTGKIVDLHSFMTDSSDSTDNAKTTRERILAGVPAAIETDEGLVVIGEGSRSASRTLAPLASQTAELTGTLYEKHGLRYIDVVSAKAAGSKMAPEEDEEDEGAPDEGDDEDEDEDEEDGEE